MSHADTIRTVLHWPITRFNAAEHADALAALDALVAENQRLREALEQFANPQHWGMTHDYSRERVPVWIGTYRLPPTEFARTVLDGRDA